MGDPVEFVQRLRDGRTILRGNEAMSPGERASYNTDAVRGFVNAITPGAAQIVLVNAPLFYNLQVADIVFITEYCVQLQTVNDWVDFEIGHTTQINGGGAFTPVSPRWRYQTGAAADGFQPVLTPTPPIRVAYAQNVLSITFRVQCNDGQTAITPYWRGYIMRERA